MVFEFLGELTQVGYRVFSVKEAKKTAESIGLKSSSVPYLLRALSSQKLIRPLFKGSYILEDNILAGSPLHKFEIAMHLAKEGAIGCWSALSYYELTDQVLSKVYVLSPYTEDKKRSLYQYKINGYDYLLIQIQQENFWGIEKVFLGDIKVSITDLERTLIDGLMRPQYCGGFREVLNAFTLARNRLDPHKIIEYGKRCPVAVQKRLGWVLNHLAIQEDLEIPLTQHFDKLDSSGPRRGKQNKTWMIFENI